MSSQRVKLKRLRERLEWLKTRAPTAPVKKRPFDLGEIASLEWAIPILEAKINADEQDRMLAALHLEPLATE